MQAKQQKQLSKTEQKELAKALYLSNLEYTNKYIAESVKITEKTLRVWIEDGKWREIREAHNFSEDELLPVWQKQLKRMTDFIESNKDEKLRFGSSKEYDAMIKLNSAIRTFSKPPLSFTINNLMNFINYIRSADVELAKQIGEFADSFIKNEASKK